jgi:hypothetical protein
MKSHFAVIELSATARSSVRNAIVSPEGKLMRPNSMKLEAFTVRLAWHSHLLSFC